MKSTRWIGAILLAAAVAGVLAWRSASDADARPAYRTATLERGSLQASVSASGTITPVTQVQVSSQVSGQIKDLYVDFNSEVRKGQLIARLDPQTYEYRVAQARADVEAARAAVLTAQANVQQALAQVARAQVDLQEAERDLERKRDLVAQNFIAAAEADKAAALVRTLTEALNAARAQAEVARAQVRNTQAVVRQREAQLAQSEVDLGRTQIRSPVDGVVIKRSVEVGQTVAASLQAPELFVIARNLSDLQVEVPVDEADIARVQPGQAVGFTIDAFPGRRFEGEVRQVRKAAVVTQNVVTYTVVVAFTHARERLLPGMTANVRIVTDHREAALKVPNAALRVRLPGAEPAGPGGDDARPQVARRSGDDGERVARARPATRPLSRGRVYRLDDQGQPVAHRVGLGITDGVSTELLVAPGSPEAELLKEGAAVVTGVNGATAKPGARSRSPF